VSRVKDSIRLLTEMPGYEEIFTHFRKEYAARVMGCHESAIIDMRRRYTWLEEFKTEIDNMNSEN